MADAMEAIHLLLNSINVKKDKLVMAAKDPNLPSGLRAARMQVIKEDIMRLQSEVLPLMEKELYLLKSSK